MPARCVSPRLSSGFPDACPARRRALPSIHPRQSSTWFLDLGRLGGWLAAEQPQLLPRPAYTQAAGARLEAWQRRHWA